MKIIIFRYSPNVLKLEYLKDEEVLIIAPESQKEKYLQVENSRLNVTFLMDYTLPYIIRELRKIQEDDFIESITTLSEDDMDWVGLLHDYFVKKGSSFCSNSLFRDKYLMRSFLIDQVPQPKFRLLRNRDDLEYFWNNCRTDKALIKPRKGAGSENIIQITKEDTNTIGPEYFLGNFLVEEYLSFKSMMTCDGFSIGQDIQRWFSHEYEEPLFDSLSTTKELVVRTNHLYFSNTALLNKARHGCEKVLKLFAIEKEVTAFHFEWFYSEETMELCFCEVGKRFGGASIPMLINLSFGVDILKEYWERVVGPSKKSSPNDCQSLSKPSKIATTYLPYKDSGNIVEVPDKEEFNWTIRTDYRVQSGQDIEKTEMIMDGLFSSIFISKDEKDYKENLYKIRKLAKKFNYK